MLAALALAAGACSNSDTGPAITTATLPTPPLTTEVTSTEVPDTATPATPATPASAPSETAVVTSSTAVFDPSALFAGAASRSVLPTVGGARDYLANAPGWDDLDPDDPGVFVPTWDQGRVDVGNGNESGSWVHDDLRVSALALRKGAQLVVFATADVYMIFAADAAEIIRRARALLPVDVAPTVQIVISATHNHHGPDTAFSVNDEWYDMMADQAAQAIAESVTNLVPATMAAAAGEHRFGVADARDPLIIDPALNLITFNSVTSGDTIATVVQWTSHPETTLGWAPPVDLTAACAIKEWTGDNCSAEGRYFTADYPGVVREQIHALTGGEVLYFNGPLGSQIGPGQADVWLVDDAHPVGDGVTPPEGAKPVPGAADFRDRNLARTLAIGTQLSVAVQGLLESPTAEVVDAIRVREQPFYTRLTNIGFRVLLADGDLGWQSPNVYNCGAKPFTDDTCVDDAGELLDDPVLTPLVHSQIRKGDVLKTQIIHVDLGDVGLLFMPGELPPELVIGLPADFESNTAAYYSAANDGEPGLHAVGANYKIPGYLLQLVHEAITITVGLGGDELGYWVPINDARLKCLDLALPPGTTCRQLFEAGVLVAPDAIGGPLCRQITDDPAALDAFAADIAGGIAATCRYGQALGRELGEPSGHYEETNSAGWDLVDDTWAAAQVLMREG